MIAVLRKRRWPVLVAGAVAVVVAVAVWLLGDLPAVTPENLAAIRPSTLIYDRHGQLLYEVITGEGKQTPLAFEEIPTACWQATVAVEDSRFFQHPGVDPLAIARAAWQNLRSGEVVSGASTLTQQLARNTLLAPDERYEHTLRRKLREAWLAWQIELRYSKEEILALYLNQVYYGNFAYGLEAAAEAFFGEPAQELDLAECSLLAGLVQSPGAYNPLQDLDAARWRQSTVLSLMVWNGAISREEAKLALAEKLQFAATPFPIEAPHFVSYAEAQLERLLGAERVSQGGLRVTTTLDLDRQHQAESTVVRHLARLAADPEAPADRRIENAAVVGLDPQTGAIVTMVGSPDYFDGSIAGAVNAAVALRQPGSAIKPITYAAAMDPQRATETGQTPLTAASVIADVRTAFTTAEGEPYVPENYDRRWHGPVSARTALASSLNLPAVKVLDQIGIDALIGQARRQGITSFRPGGAAPGTSTGYGLALTLGGGEVSLLELTSAYAVFANGGYRVEPYAIERVEDVDGEVLFQAPQRAARAQALDPQVAFLITDILADNDARALSFGRNSVLQLSRPAAVKTGTTTDWRDNWTVGYTPQLVTGVWVGNADNAPMLGVSGVTGAGPIWHDFMELAHRHLPVQKFAQPPGFVRTEICIDSGLLATELCQRRRTELFIAGTEPTTFDDVYQERLIDSCSNMVANRAESPAPGCLARQVVRVYPPELQEWAAANGSALVAGSTPVKVAALDAVPAAGQGLVLTSPDPNSVFRISASVPAELQQVRLAARPMGTGQLKQLTFMVDGEPLDTVTELPFEAWWTLQPGVHQVGAVAQNESGAQISAEPIWIEIR